MPNLEVTDLLAPIGLRKAKSSLLLFWLIQPRLGCRPPGDETAHTCGRSEDDHHGTQQGTAPEIVDAGSGANSKLSHTAIPRTRFGPRMRAHLLPYQPETPHLAL